MKQPTFPHLHRPRAAVPRPAWTRCDAALRAVGLERVTFRQAILLFIPAYALHIVEEFPRFIEWAHCYPGLYGGAMDAMKFAVGSQGDGWARGIAHARVGSGCARVLAHLAQSP